MYGQSPSCSPLHMLPRCVRLVSALLSLVTCQPWVSGVLGDMGVVVGSSVPGVVSAHTPWEHFRKGLSCGCTEDKGHAVSSSVHSAEWTRVPSYGEKDLGAHIESK